MTVKFSRDPGTPIKYPSLNFVERSRDAGTKTTVTFIVETMNKHCDIGLGFAVSIISRSAVTNYCAKKMEPNKFILHVSQTQWKDLRTFTIKTKYTKSPP